MRTEAAQVVHTVVTTTATGVTVATLLGWLPLLAAGLASIWYVIIILEKILNKPVHRWFRK